LTRWRIGAAWATRTSALYQIAEKELAQQHNTGKEHDAGERDEEDEIGEGHTGPLRAPRHP